MCDIFILVVMGVMGLGDWVVGKKIFIVIGGCRVRPEEERRFGVSLRIREVGLESVVGCNFLLS